MSCIVEGDIGHKEELLQRNQARELVDILVQRNHPELVVNADLPDKSDLEILQIELCLLILEALTETYPVRKALVVAHQDVGGAAHLHEVRVGRVDQILFT